MQTTYGTLLYSAAGSTWRVICEPQVRARMKRVFPRVRQHAAEHIDLSATPENSRELQWFTQRYPLAMDADTQRALQQLADEHVDMERSLVELLAGRVQIPEFSLAKP
ncbi:hypothetical protein, partial [Escherichia coli]|uniref:hypothetical protein n=1 Tax=Escherichia coli TaxID=562 RepID=UPI00399C5598